MRRNLLLALGALTALTAAVRADPLLTFGPDIPIWLTAAGSVREDSNVLLANTAPKADTVFSVSPGLDYHFKGAEGSAGLTFDEQFNRFATQHQLNSNLADLEGSLALTGAQSTIAGAASYQQTDSTSLTALNADQTVKHAVGSASLTGEWGVAPRTRIGVGALFTRTTYPETGLQSSDVWQIPVNAFYALTPKVDMSLGYQHARTDLASGVGSANDDFYNVGARGEFTPKLSGQFRVGVDEHTTAGTPGRNSQLGLDATLSYALTARTSLDLNGSSSFGKSPTGTTQEDRSGGLTARFELTNALSASVSGTYSSTVYLTTPGRTDNFWFANLAVGYAIARDTQAQVVCIARQNSSTVSSSGFHDNIVMFSVATRF